MNILEQWSAAADFFFDELGGDDLRVCALRLMQSGESMTGKIHANISVALCSYEGSAWLREQLASIASQTRPPDELIVCDDASQDDGCDIVRDFATRVSFPVRLYKNPNNLGFVKNFERAIRLCSGDVIALCDQDDVWMPEKLETMEKTFAAAPDAILCFSDAELVNADLSTTKKTLWDAVFFQSQRRAMQEGRTWSALLHRNFVAGATLAFRSELRTAALPLPPNLDYIHDGWIAVIASFVGQVRAIPVPLIKYRLHSAQACGVPAVCEEDAAATRRERLAVRTAYFVGAVRRLEAIRERLAQAKITLDEERRAYLDGLILHMKARAHLPQARRKRLELILRELSAGRYRLYNKGWLSAGKDFWV